MMSRSLYVSQHGHGDRVKSWPWVQLHDPAGNEHTHAVNTVGVYGQDNWTLLSQGTAAPLVFPTPSTTDDSTVNTGAEE